ncbi:AIC_G0052760.mRNA.1.CDS.1 [Saccharomyces cerevisiae]|nr:AIC_G0052760.mRNA.1.CDS.1 [Saccharomyces cerevisiae]CAI6896553.1 AIC_G0052760.mRNA.1.CDS.1 [Saccharomyces cerevisiae]
MTTIIVSYQNQNCGHNVLCDRNDVRTSNFGDRDFSVHLQLLNRHGLNRRQRLHRASGGELPVSRDVGGKKGRSNDNFSVFQLPVYRWDLAQGHLSMVVTTHPTSLFFNEISDTKFIFNTPQ